MNTEQQYKNWKLATDADNILWLTFDRANSSVNSFNQDVFSELDAILDSINQQKPAGVIIQSGKAKGFIAGADISQFPEMKNTDQAYDLIRGAQIILNKLEALDVPTVSLVNGFCMGGGTEFILACRYRIACEDPSTRISLPEVKLGVQPGWAGTVRLPLLVGGIKAMNMILTGAAFSARACKKMGLVDAVVPLRELKRAGVYYIKKQPPKHKPSLFEAMTNLPGIRHMLGKVMYKQLAKKHVIKEHYPAPYAIVDNWIKDGARGDAMVNEAKSIAKLMMTDTSRNLVRVFFLQTAMKHLAKGSTFNPQHVHVVGAGAMGGDIAAWCAYKGMRVTLQDQSPEKIAPAIKRAYKLFKKKLKQPRLIQAAMDRLQPDITGNGVVSADLVIEAIFEDVHAKQELFKAVESRLKPSAILASNTSSIPLEDIASALQDPTRLVGIHFFNPVAKMPLVEVVYGKDTRDDIIKDAAKFVTKISRSPLKVKSSPGFLINRILMPYMLEAMHILQEGVPAETIDNIAVQFGMPMGPITLADMVGLDICLHAATKLMTALGGKVPSQLQQMVDAGHIGVKSGQGFYKYKDGKKINVPAANSHADTNDVCDRLILSMVNESVACLHEGVVSDADALDIGMIFGTGFAPFRGGPIQYAKTRGVNVVKTRLQALAQKYGERFTPKAGWNLIDEPDRLAKEDAKTADQDINIEATDDASQQSIKEIKTE